MSLRVRSSSVRVQRLENRARDDIDRLLMQTLPSSYSRLWEDIIGPNVTDKDTILSAAKMAAAAYSPKGNLSEWSDVGGGFEYSDDFGWQGDGLRGHIFADETNATVVVSLKGTSVTWFDEPDTTERDRFNDNLFGSCCCAQGSHYLYKTVCSCKTSTYTCNSTCLSSELQEKSRYYSAARNIYHNVTDLYPNSSVWLVGHSLGGVVCSLLGLTYGLPTITFEAFPDALAASRLGLPTPPGHHAGDMQQGGYSPHIYHFGHTADPIYMGECNGASSFCTLWGYAFEGLCHTGQRCTYDTVQDLGWRKSVRSHSISTVIADVIKKYRTVPVCAADIDCIDCALWKFEGRNHTTIGSTAWRDRDGSRGEGDNL